MSRYYDTLNLADSLRINNTTVIDSSRYVKGARLYADGASGYFYNDSSSRTAFTGGDFYIQSIGTYYNYATNQYHGNSSGDNHYFRGNALSGNSWSINTAGSATFNSVTAAGNITAYSDARLKDNVKTLDGSKVYEMRGVSFTKDGELGSGVIAQELEQVAPELVMTNDDEMQTKSVAYGNVVGYLIEAIKELKQEVEDLKSQLEK